MGEIHHLFPMNKKLLFGVNPRIPGIDFAKRKTIKMSIEQGQAAESISNKIFNYLKSNPYILLSFLGIPVLLYTTRWGLGTEADGSC